VKLNTHLSKYIYPKLKFVAGSIISTGVDYSVFFLLLSTSYTLPVALIQLIAQSFGMLSNFLIQRNFIFAKHRTITASLIWSVSFSIIALTLSSILIHYLYIITFFNENPLIMKIGVSVIFFFFNFYTKQFAFEKKIKW